MQIDINRFKTFDKRVTIIGDRTKDIQMYLYPLDNYVRYEVRQHCQEVNEVKTLEEAVGLYNSLEGEQ